VVNCGSNSIRDKTSFHKFPSVYNNNGKIDPLAQKRKEKWKKVQIFGKSCTLVLTLAKFQDG